MSLRRGRANTFLPAIHMRINRAIGMGIGILVLGTLMPAVFAALEVTLLKFFEASGSIFDAAQTVLHRSGL